MAPQSVRILRRNSLSSLAVRLLVAFRVLLRLMVVICDSLGGKEEDDFRRDRERGVDIFYKKRGMTIGNIFLEGGLGGSVWFYLGMRC